MVYGCCHRVPSRVAQCQWNICFPSTSCVYCCRWWLTITRCQFAYQCDNGKYISPPQSIQQSLIRARGMQPIELICQIPCKLALPSHKISIYENVLTPHFHRLPHTCYILRQDIILSLLEEPSPSAEQRCSSQLRALQGYSHDTREKEILTQMGCAGSAWFDIDMPCTRVTPRSVFKNNEHLLHRVTAL